jgi:hypothetical protein
MKIFGVILIQSILLLTLLFSFESCSVNEKKSDDIFVPVRFSEIITTGELGMRMNRNFNRLEEEKYQPDHVFLTNEESNWWPGDTEGRTVLALTLEAQALHRTPKYLDEIVRLFPEKMNKKGYFGDIYPDSIADEQQLSSHGWVLRGLCEYYEWKKDSSVLQMIEKVIQNLALPTSGMHLNYPLDPQMREVGGSYSGNRENKTINNWILSTDIGCDFIFLDGLTQAYKITHDKKTKLLIDEMVDKFLQVPQLKISTQTHATLTALRAVLRYYEESKDENLLKAVIDRFSIYKQNGMTENYENYNWYGRPLWTEPCAIIDSYIVAVNLWRFTGNIQYLEDAQMIYYNGIGATQRYNGGFGCNSCSGAKDPFVEVKVQEAHWCCTMRGGEGLPRVSESQYYVKDDTLLVTLFNPNQAKIELKNSTFQIKQETSYPGSGSTKLNLHTISSSGKTVIGFFTPQWVKNVSLIVDGKPVKSEVVKGFVYFKSDLLENTVIDLLFENKIVKVATVNNQSIQGYHRWQYGPLILGCEEQYEVHPREGETVVQELGNFKFRENGQLLSPLHHVMDSSVFKGSWRKQILFNP